MNHRKKDPAKTYSDSTALSALGRGSGPFRAMFTEARHRLFVMELMDQQGPQGFWTNMSGQRSVMDTNCARNPTVVLSGPPGHLVPPAPHLRQSDSLLDGEKAGATLLFTGVFLTLVGVTFTTMGWQHYKVNPSFEWPQLVGPILISVGGTFVFTSVCKFGIISCWRCRQLDEEVLVMPVMEQTSAGHSFTLSGINQPIMLRGGTTMLCIPPPYNFITQEVSQANEFQPGSSVSAALPPLDTACCVDNAAFTAEEADSSDVRGSRIEKTEDERGRGDESGSPCARPPAYEDICPSFNKRNLT